MLYILLQKTMRAEQFTQMRTSIFRGHRHWGELQIKMTFTSKTSSGLRVDWRFNMLEAAHLLRTCFHR